MERAALVYGLLVTLVLPVTLANAESIRLSDLTREDQVAIQRGYSVAEAACVFALLREIEGYGGPQAMQEFTITFDDAPLKISDGQLTHTCDEGVHTWIDGDGAVVIQVYDEDGKPTLEEPE